MLETKEYYTEEDMIKLDMEKNFIPLTFDGIFKGIFKKDLELLKKFILSQLEFDIELDKCKIELLDSELPKDKAFEYQKTVDIYVKIGNLYVNIEINREYFKSVEKRNFIFAEKLHAMLLEKGENIESINDRIFVQINLNAVDKLDDKKEKLTYGDDTIVLYGMKTGKVYDDNKYILVKFLEYYRDLYYTKSEKLDESDLWLVLFASRSFQEMFNVAKEIFDEQMRDQFIRKVVNMSQKRRYFEDWELEQLNQLVEYKKEQFAIEDGLKQGLEKGLQQGIEQGIQQGIEQGLEQGLEQGREQTIDFVVKKMLEEEIDVSMISKITNKTEEEIMKIKESL